MYAVDSSSFLLCNFLAVDLITGVGTVKNSVPVPCADGLTFSSTGKLYAFRFAPSAPPGPTALVTIDPATGAETVIGPVPHVFEAGMAFDGAGSLWLYGLASSSEPSCTTSGPKSCLWKIDPATGAATFVGGSNFLVQSLGGSCTQVVTVAKATPESQANLYQVNTATAALTSLAPVSGFQFATGLAYDRSGGLWAIGPSTDGSSVVVTRVGANGSTSPVTVTVNGAPFVKGGFGLAIDPLSCVINVIVVQPKFTG